MDFRRSHGLVFVAAVSAVFACSSHSSGPREGTDAGSGGAAGSGTGGSNTSGGQGGVTGGAGGTLEAGGSSEGGAPDSGSDGAPEAGPSAGGAAPDAGKNPLQGLAAYPVVPYTVENPKDDNKAMLGKILFWEEQMGQLDTMACGTCHRAEAGGSDPRAAILPAAHLPGYDGILDPNPGPLSDDLRVAVGMPVCSQAGVIDTSQPVQTTTRKPPSYLDAMFADQVFWDGRAGYCKKLSADAGQRIDSAVGGCFYDPDLPADAPPLIVDEQDPVSGRIAGGALEAQAIGPPVNSHEMACANRSWADIAAKLATVTPLAKARAIPQDMLAFLAQHGPTYPDLFQFVYGNQSGTKVHPATDADNVINTRRVVFAITTHERRLISNQTPWDLWNAGDDSAMTPRQVEGFEVFMGKAQCNRCHSPPLFTDLTFHYIGFHEPFWDTGREAIVVPDDHTLEGKMKTPTLRNVGLREAGGLLHSGEGPGHDLPTVLSLYEQGGRQDSAALLLRDPTIQAFTLTADELAALTDFLRNALTDPRVQQETTPFDRPRLSTE